MTKTLIAKNLLIGGLLKGTFKYASPNVGGYTFVNPCIACGENHNGAYSAWVDGRRSMFIKCPTTDEKVYMIWG